MTTESAGPPETPASAIEQLLAVVKEQLTKMQNPNTPVYKLTIERTGFGFDENRVPQVAEFMVKLEHVTTVAQLPTVGVSGLIMPDNLRKNT